MGYAFISYSHDDKAFVERLAGQLRKDGVEVWSDHSLITGDKYPELIEEKIAGCAVFVPVMSAASKASPWVVRECKDAEKYQRVVMPVGLDNLIFDRYRDVLCDMTAPTGTASERFRQGLREACQPSVRFTQGPAWTGHGRAVRSIAFSADGGLLASADDHGVRAWDTRTGTDRVNIIGGLDPTWPVAVTIDGRIASAANHQPGVHLWNPNTGALFRSLGTHEQTRSISFSPDGRWLATGGEDQTARLWAADNGKPITRLSAGPMVPAWPLAFSPDSRHLAVANLGSDSASVWSAGTWIKNHRLSRASRVSALCWNPNSSIVISGGQSGDVSLHGLSQEEGEVLRQLQPHSSTVHAVACAPNGRIFATAGHDGTVKIIGVVTGEVVQTLMGHDGPVYAVAFSPDGFTLASAGADRAIRVWRTKGKA